MREFADKQGARWTVYAVNTDSNSDSARRSLPGNFRGGWLVFESGARKLRLAPVPAGWDDLADDALQGLLAAATPTTPTTPRGHPAFGSTPRPDAGGGNAE